jgi:hypothetical protein
MDYRTPLDKRLQCWKLLNPVNPYYVWSEVTDAANFVSDGLEFSNTIATTVFGKKVTPDVVLGIYDRYYARLQAIHKPED